MTTPPSVDTAVKFHLADLTDTVATLHRQALEDGCTCSPWVDFHIVPEPEVFIAGLTHADDCHAAEVESA